jgi:hypothetical protein
VRCNVSTGLLCRTLLVLQSPEDVASQVLQQLSAIPNGAAGVYLLGMIAKSVGKKPEAIAYLQAALASDPYLWSAFEALCSLGVDAAPQVWASAAVDPSVSSALPADNTTPEASPFILRHAVMGDVNTSVVSTESSTPFTPAVRMQLFSPAMGTTVTPVPNTPQPGASKPPLPSLLSPAAPTHTLTPIGDVTVAGGGLTLAHAAPPAAPAKQRQDPARTVSKPPGTAQKLFGSSSIIETAAPVASVPLPPPPPAPAARPSAPGPISSPPLSPGSVFSLLGTCAAALQHLSMYDCGAKECGFDFVLSWYPDLELVGHEARKQSLC